MEKCQQGCPVTVSQVIDDCKDSLAKARAQSFVLRCIPEDCTVAAQLVVWAAFIDPRQDQGFSPLLDEKSFYEKLLRMYLMCMDVVGEDELGQASGDAMTSRRSS